LVEDAVGGGRLGGHALTLLAGCWGHPFATRSGDGRPAPTKTHRPPLAAGPTKQAPAGPAGGRPRGPTLGGCSGAKRREAPCGKRLEPMSQEPAPGVRPSTNSPDRASI